MNTFLTYGCMFMSDVTNQIKIPNNLCFDLNLQNSNVRLGIYRKETLRGLL